MDCGVSHFGDRRLDQAGSFLHDRLVKLGPRGISVRSVGGNRAGEVRIGRFLRNEKVTVEKIVEQALLDTASRVDGLHILAIQDTTSFRDDGSGNSLVGHSTIAVEAEHGALLGLIDAQIIERSGSGERLPRKRALRDKQSQRWIDGMQTSARLMTLAARVTVVADREGDIFEMFACRPEGVEFLIRAAQDRMLSEGAGKLFSSLANRGQRKTIRSNCRPVPDKRNARPGSACVSPTSPLGNQRTGLSSPAWPCGSPSVLSRRAK